MSTLATNTFQELATGDSVGAKYVVRGTAKAWANLNGTGTIALRDSLNISSVVDEGTGDYRFNYTNAMTNGNYCYTTAVEDVSVALISVNFVSFPKTTTSIRTGSRFVSNTSGSATADDADGVQVAIHGDLA
jgi:hypothetical protein